MLNFYQLRVKFTIKVLQKKNYITPTTRFASVITLPDTQRVNQRQFHKNKFQVKANKKIFHKHKCYTPANSLGLNFAGVITNYVYNFKPYKLMLNIKTIYNQSLVWPGVESIIPGRSIFDLSKNYLSTQYSYLGSQITLGSLPYHITINSINNYNNFKKTFAKASGASAMKLKAKKTVKLILVEMPSENTYFFLKETKCLIGGVYNFFNHKFVEGKWGFSLHKTKTLHVRGVAMNPVDHPNGGRTKSKQPEKSPWGWIAKRGK